MQASEPFAGMQDAPAAFFSGLPLGAMLLDRAGTILAANAQQLANSGVPSEKLVGAKLHDVFAGVLQRYDLDKPYRALLEDGRAWELQPDGVWKQLAPRKGEQVRSAQGTLMRSARRRHRSSRVA